MRKILAIVALLLSAFLVACGGGGGGAGTTTGSQGTAATSTPLIAVALYDANGQILTTNMVTAGTTYTVRALVTDGKGVALPNQLVTFTADAAIGTLTPGSAITDSSGIATVRLSPVASGASSIQVDATVGSQSVSGQLAFQTVVQRAPTNIEFVSATPSLMVVSGAATGTKTSTVKFRVVNEVGVGIEGRQVVLSLNKQALDAGVTFTVGGATTTSDQTRVSDGNGEVQIAVAAGAFPTPVLVAAKLQNTTISASSAGLSVTNGRASQGRISLAASILSVEASGGGGSTYDGVESQLTMRIADRLANPVPIGTAVNFVASSGLVTGSCVTDASSLCTVTWRSQGPRPANGLLTILGYLDGEESFVDLNGNNAYDVGEPFQDLGQLFLDRDANGVYDASGDQIVADNPALNQVCAGTLGPGPYGISGRCDGIWSASTRIRSGLVVAWSNSYATISVIQQASESVTYHVSDDKGNSVPSGSTFTAAFTCPDGVTAPKMVRVSLDKQPNSISSQDVMVWFDQPIYKVPTTSASAAAPAAPGPCSLDFTVTAPSGTKTTLQVKVAYVTQ